MLYLHDVWLNWIRDVGNGLEVYEFHEWNKDDEIIALDQIPIVKVNEKFMDVFENNNVVVPGELLDMVHQMAFARAGRGRKRLEYAFILSDGERILAVDTEGTNITVLKSRLIPRQHHLALELVSSSSTTYDFELPEVIEDESKLNFIDLVGLTRREKELKRLVLNGLKEVKNKGNVDELRYYLSEINPSNYKKIKKLDIDTCFNNLMELFHKGWSKEHEELCRVFLKVNNDTSKTS